MVTLPNRSIFDRMGDMLAQLESESECQRKRVGCIIATTTGIVLSTGSNGPLFGETCNGPEAIGRCGCVHAETRAIDSRIVAMLLFGSPVDIYTTTSPCWKCAQDALQVAKVRCWYFREPYRDAAPLAQLDARGVHSQRF